jgi:5-methylthioadenosine/S-adenosylhomocysteine deaminase
MKKVYSRLFALIRGSACLLLLAVAAWAEPADWIWSARYVVTMDAGRRVIENGAVAIRGERIVAVGTRAEIDRRFQTRQRLDRPESLIAPGLVNTHAHAAMSLFRGIADDLRLQEWLEKYIFPAEARNVSPEFVRWGTRLACLEMLLSGTTTYADMYYFEDVVAEATKEAGLRGVLGETIIGFPAPDAKTPAEALRFTERYIERFRNDPLIVPAVAPHALYTNSEETLRACRRLANRYGVPLLTHVAETRRERDDALAKWNKTPVAVLDSFGVFDGRTVAAHAVWVNDADLAILKARGVGVAHCPSSNMKLASGVAPVVKMLALGLAVGLGTDGPAGSNNDFNLMEEMDLAAKLQKVTSGDPQALPASQAVEMATILGARVLGLEKEIGSIESGKRADLITLRLDRPNAVPLYGVYSQMVYALKGCDVRDAMVNGRVLLRDRQALTMNAAEILAKAEELGAKVRESLK